MSKAPKKTVAKDDKDTGLGAGTGDQGGIDATADNPGKPDSEKPGQHGNIVRGGPGNPSNKIASDAAIGKKTPADNDVSMPGSKTMRAKITSAANDPVDVVVNGHKASMRVGQEYTISESQMEALKNGGVTVEEIKE